MSLFTKFTSTSARVVAAFTFLATQLLTPVILTGNVSAVDSTTQETVQETAEPSIQLDPQTEEPITPLAPNASVLSAPTSSASVSTNSVPNPLLSQACGLDIALVIDSSGSIDNTELGQMKTAFNGFVNAFLPATPTQFSVTEFDTTASVTSAFTNNAATTTAAINGASSGGFTNWEDGLTKAASTFDPRPTKQNLVVFASDGNPNTVIGGSGGASTEADATNAAVTVANSIKSSNTRILALGIGNNLDLDNLKAISGPTVNNGVNSDVITTDFATLATTLSNLAQELCGGTITIQKLVDADGDPKTTNDQTPAADWTFDIESQGVDIEPVTTDSDGYTPSVEVDPARYLITETLKPGYELLDASCSGATNNGTLNASENRIESVSVGSSDIVNCTFINAKNSGRLVVVKDSQPNDEQDFEFLIFKGQKGGAFELDDDGNDNNELSSYREFNSLLTGVWTIQEKQLDGWTLSNVDCGDFQFKQDGNSIYLDVKPGDDIKCVFTNQKDGQLTVVKNAIPNGPKVFDFKISNGQSSNSFSLDDDPNTNLPNYRTDSVAPGEYVISEDNYPDWALYKIDCGEAKHVRDGSSVTVFVQPGEEVKCEFTNVKKGSITVIKDARPNYDQDFEFTLEHEKNSEKFVLSDENANDDHTKVFERVLPGEYRLSEQYVEGWELEKIRCNVEFNQDGQTVYFKVRPGEHVVCEFVNVGRASLTVVKEARPYGSTQTFDFVGERGDRQIEFTLDDDGDSYNEYSNYKRFDDVQVGRIATITENKTEGWDLVNIRCYEVRDKLLGGDSLVQRPDDNVDYKVDGSSVSVYLRPGQEVVCKFTNHEQGSVKVTKFHDLNHNGYWDEDEPTLEGWDFTLETTKKNDDNLVTRQAETSQHNEYSETQTTGEDGMTTFEDLRTGRRSHYVLSEEQQDGWVLSNMYCSREFLPIDRPNIFEDEFETEELRVPHMKDSLRVKVHPGENKECYVGNYQLGVLSIEKFNDTPEPTTNGELVTYTIVVTNPTDSGCIFGNIMTPEYEETLASEEYGYQYQPDCLFEEEMFEGEVSLLQYINEAEEPIEMEETAVTVTDLPPSGFTYVEDSWTASSSVRGDLKAQGITTEPTYASPGQWNLTNALSNFLVPGEVVTLTYQALIQNVVSNGTHGDTAFVNGLDASSSTVYGNLHFVDTPFVGTEVTLASVDTDTDEFVLGTRILAETGFPAFAQVGLGMSLAGAAVLVTAGDRLKKLFKGVSKSVGVLALFFGMMAMLGGSASAFDSWTFKAIDPPTVTSSDSINLGYQVVSIDDSNEWEVSATQNGQPLETQSVTTDFGDSNAFSVTFPSEGVFDYVLTASVVSGANAGEVQQISFSVEYDESAPASPTLISKVQNGTEWTISFLVPAGSSATTVQVFASTDSTFTADNSTLVGTVDATPGTEQTFTYDAGDTNERFFAIRSVDAANNVSALDGGDQVVVTTPAGSSSGVASESTSGATDGEVLADQDEGTDDSQQDNDDDGEEDEDSAAIWIIVALVAVAVAGGIYWQTRNEE